jgi:Fur family zinc uptake transcriptional regulator
MNNVHVLNPFKQQQHNHDRCIKAALANAEQACNKAGLRLTPLRKQVLELVWRNHAPVKAYDLLEQLHKDNPRAAPPTVYRALEFLQQAGLVHRLESLNAFVGCGDPSEPHVGQFLICRDCGAVAEINDPSITRALTDEAQQLGFASDSQVVEIKGRCPACK